MNLAKFKDGLYRVECGSIVGGFVISNGHLVRIAPILRKNFYLFTRHAVWISDSIESPHEKLLTNESRD